MIPAPFSYRRAGTVEEALDLAAEAGDDGKYLAGGHSLLPLMKLRFAVPEVLIDIGRLDELSYIRDSGGHISVGALTRLHDLEHSELLAAELPLLVRAAGAVGDPQVRHRATIGGSLAHGDAASDLPAVVLALDATLVARGPSGSREIATTDCFRGLEQPAEEVGHRDLPASRRAAGDQGGVQGQAHRGQVGGGVAVHQRSADGAPVPHLRVTDGIGGAGEQRQLGGE